MKLLLSLTLFLWSCGKETEYIHTLRHFEGFYSLPFNGQITLLEDRLSQVSLIKDNQTIVIQNEDNSFGYLPNISFTNQLPVDSTIYYSVDLSYTGNLQLRDFNNLLITGHKRTDIRLQVVENQIIMDIVIYSARIQDNVPKTIIFAHILEGTKR